MESFMGESDVFSKLCCCRITTDSVFILFSKITSQVIVTSDLLEPVNLWVLREMDKILNLL